MRTWAWVQTGRVSGHSPWVERSRNELGIPENREERERKGHRRDYHGRKKAGPHPGWAGSVRTLKNLWPALRPTSGRCYTRVLQVGTVRFTQRRQESEEKYERRTLSR